jgi:hypothetical protein
MPETISDIIDSLYEGARDGTVPRAEFGRFVLRIADMVANTKLRAAVIDHETAQILMYAKNLPRG